MKRLKRLRRDITSSRFYTHDLRIYFTRIARAIIGKRYTPMCCYTRSLDYSILRDFVDALEYFIPKHLSVHIVEKEEQDELEEMLKLGKWMLDEDNNSVLTSKLEEYQEGYDRFFFLLAKNFRSLRI